MTADRTAKLREALVEWLESAEAELKAVCLTREWSDGRTSSQWSSAGGFADAIVAAVEGVLAEDETVRPAHLAHRADVLMEVVAERARQDARWGESNHPDGTEDGEFFRTRRDFRMQATKDFARVGRVTWRHILDEEAHKAYAEVDPMVLREKLINIAAVAVAWVEAIDRRTDAGGSDAP